MKTRRFDLVILGSGSTAFAAAIRAAELGKTAAMTENRTLGGTCVNRGCLPSKNLIAAAGIIHEASHPRYAGIEPNGPYFSFPDLIRQKDEFIAYYREKKYQSIVGDRISLFDGAARFVDHNGVQVGDVRLEADRFLVATGSRPFVPPIAGLVKVPFMTSDLLTSQENIELKEQPESLNIVGGGYIALELGQFFGRLGTRVTIIEPASASCLLMNPKSPSRCPRLLGGKGSRSSHGRRSWQSEKNARVSRWSLKGIPPSSCALRICSSLRVESQTHRTSAWRRLGCALMSAARLWWTKSCGPQRPTCGQPVT